MTGGVRFALATIVVSAFAGCGASGSSTSTSSTPAVAGKVPHAHHVKRVEVPRLVGESFEQAVRNVRRAGLEQHAPAFTGTVGNPHYNGHCLRILSQSPPAGTRLPKGATVSIVYGVCGKAIAKGHHSLAPPKH